MAKANIQQEREWLVAAQRGDMQARAKLHKEYKPMLDSIIRASYSPSDPNYITNRVHAEQLLDKAIDGWSVTAANQPNTYIYNYIYNQMKRFVGQHIDPVRTVEQYNIHKDKYYASVKDLNESLKRPPTVPEIATHMQTNYPKFNFREEDVSRIQRSIRRNVLGSTSLGDESNSTVGDINFVDFNDNPLDDYLMQIKFQEMLNKVNMLPEPYKTVVLHSHGLNSSPKLSLRDLALKLGTNKYRVQVLQREAEQMLGLGG